MAHLSYNELVEELSRRVNTADRDLMNDALTTIQALQRQVKSYQNILIDIDAELITRGLYNEVEDELRIKISNMVSRINKD